MKKLKIAFQGARGSYSDEAVGEMFRERAETIPCETFDQMFQSLERGRADCVLAPMKNSLIGEIARPNELLSAGAYRVRDTYQKLISHALIGTAEAKLENIELVASHYAALAQCEKFFARQPRFERVVAADTASAVQDVVASRDPRRAAIASAKCAEIYGGRVLLENIQDAPENFTTFYLLTK